MIVYQDSVENVSQDMLSGFFIGWPSAPSKEMHLKLLKNSDFVVIVVDDATNKVAGFVTAISDKTLAAYIPFLEVLPAYQNQGIGKELMKRMLDKLKDFYMVDLSCDENLQKYYEELGMKKAHGMMIRNFDKQEGL